MKLPEPRGFHVTASGRVMDMAEALQERARAAFRAAFAAPEADEEEPTTPLSDEEIWARWNRRKAPR